MSCGGLMRSQNSNLRLDIGNHVKFYNIKSNDYKQIKLHLMIKNSLIF